MLSRGAVAKLAATSSARNKEGAGLAGGGFLFSATALSRLLSLEHLRCLRRLEGLRPQRIILFSEVAAFC